MSDEISELNETIWDLEQELAEAKETIEQQAFALDCHSDNSEMIDSCIEERDQAEAKVQKLADLVRCIIDGCCEDLLDRRYCEKQLEQILKGV